METTPQFNDIVQASDKCFEKYCNCPKCNQCDCHKPNPCDCAKDVITSIALVESALAHILNAEGEKLQKGVKLACNVDDLLKINKSVRSTLIHATFMEHTLFAKLEAVCNGCKCDDKDCSNKRC